jgi:phage I-like protein
MKNALALLATAALSAHVTELSADAADGVWIQLIPAGTFSGRDGRGPYHAGDEKSIQTIADLTRRYHGSTEIVIDYEHQTKNALQNGRPAPAAGWVKEVEARKEGLFGRVEWTAAAASAIRAREYRYLSPVYFHGKDGKIFALQNAALTNAPNLVMAEVSAHSIFQQAHEEETMKQILAALGLAEGASENDVLVAINSYLTSSTAIAAAAGLTKDAKSEAILTAVQSAFADRKKIAIAVGKSETATADEIVAAISSAHSAAVDPTRFVPIEQVSAMQADIKKLQDQLGEDKANEAVDKAVREGKLAPALKDWGLSMHRANPEKFDEFVGKAPVLTSAQRTATAKVPGAEPGIEQLDDADLAVMRQMGLSQEQMLKAKKGGDA